MENSIENEENVQEVVNNEETNTTINCAPLPLQNLQEFDHIFSLGGQEFQLNNSGTKRLVVGITSREMPELQVVFKLHDTKNGKCIQFFKKTWDTIIHFSSIIKSHLEVGVFDEVFDNHRITVSTSIFYSRFCVIFTDRSEEHVVMMPETFDTMICLKDEINHAYAEMHKNIKDVTKRIKLFMDLSFFHLFKSNNIDSRHNYNWLTLFLNKSESFSELNKSIAKTWMELGTWVDKHEENDDAST